ncbi:MAG: hypothetical protein EOO20_14415 [Chryseobacterium sp.]|nr:MAG: hypothetical protein EOO20_14415 [Chryseobacterium sp.]
MDLKYVETLLSNLEEILESLTPATQLYSERLGTINSVCLELKTHVLKTGFSDDIQEIFFFKNLKPRFYAHLIFEVEFYNITSSSPKNTNQKLYDYYLLELSYIDRVFSHNAFLYQYFLAEEVALDKSYFLRSTVDNRLSATNGIANGSADEAFSTNQDYTVAKFMAFEKLRKIILDKLASLDPKSGIEFTGRNPFKKKSLNWTDDKVNLVELAYGIYLMGSLNNGKASLGDVVGMLEESLKIDLGYVYRKFVDISRRKSSSYTKYLDLMGMRINSYITEGHG